MNSNSSTQLFNPQNATVLHQTNILNHMNEYKLFMQLCGKQFSVINMVASCYLVLLPILIGSKKWTHHCSVTSHN
jgi:hypothetical protein